MKRPGLISLDAFAKTVEDASIKTTSGGIITLICVLMAMILVRNEYNDYKLIVNVPELVVDRDLNKKLDILLDVTFFNLPCELFSLDILDTTGDINLDILNSGFEKFRIIPGTNEEIKEESLILSNQLSLEETAKGLESGQENEPCGSCYGALPQDNKEYCCNSCAAVRLAYSKNAWEFFDGEGIAQCEAEGYVSRIREKIERNEGCRVKGRAQINRIAGNLHFAPGSPITMQGRHIHDLSLYRKYGSKFNFDHVINHFSFGSDPHISSDVTGSTHPLDGYRYELNKKHQVISYYLKVVASRYEYLTRPVLETNQFSVITHDRPLKGGRDEDHQHTIHAQGGVPGLFFHFEISPLKIINREQYAKTWSGFVLGVISSIAGVLIIGTLLDRSAWAAEKVIRSKKDI